MKHRKGDLPNEMQCTEAELRAMTAEMNEMHQATFPQMRARLAEFGSSLRRHRVSEAARADRRRFLVTGSGLVVGGFVLAACGNDTDSTDNNAGSGTSDTGSDTSPKPNPGGGGGADNESLQLNASLENLAVFAYSSALEAAPKGMFGKTVPKAVAEFAMHAKMQHSEHAEAFNAALTNAGGQAYSEPTPGLAPAVKQMFAKVDSIPKLAMLALTLENTAAATYVAQMGELTSPEAISAVATIAPVERQHAAILTYLLGDYPVPATFVPLKKSETSLGAQDSSALTAA